MNRRYNNVPVWSNTTPSEHLNQVWYVYSKTGLDDATADKFAKTNKVKTTNKDTQ